VGFRERNERKQSSTYAWLRSRSTPITEEEFTWSWGGAVRAQSKNIGGWIMSGVVFEAKKEIAEKVGAGWRRMTRGEEKSRSLSPFGMTLAEVGR
jgi:hypothetical protein